MNGGRLGVGGALAGLAGSYVGLVVAVLTMSLNPLLPTAVAAATPVWLAAVVVLGLPAAGWIERRLPPDPPVARRYGAYAVAGLACGGLIALLVALVFRSPDLSRWLAPVRAGPRGAVYSRPVNDAGMSRFVWRTRQTSTWSSRST
ncbi:hypothetical protein [Jiangella alba]|uniref:Uncharacterized protein n=1 Tax=Jiangella alba TaxID=561176 RepID=A0A1H5IXI1_9ACTN|nr:hypothetical protein [Jiangella alba]SEE44757.1 hypothetical protein SAMN04488561_1351 [Jiangella alba]